MYQVRDKKNNKIIARFVKRKDAEEFLKIKRLQERGRYEIVAAGKKNSE